MHGLDTDIRSALERSKILFDTDESWASVATFFARKQRQISVVQMCHAARN